jgi:diaminopimelate decarboxylase
MSLIRIPAPIRMPDLFAYRNGELHAEKVPVSRFAESVAKPFYIYSAGELISRVREFSAGFGS